MFNCDKIQDNSLTPDKVLNSFDRCISFCIVRYTSWVHFLWPTWYFTLLQRAMQSAVLARGISSVRHVPVLCPDE